ncbi:two-component response regulator ARR10-like [Rhodamnia argentea]|uniref:Two-component response regulator ARR10-like n=1 Tax=Rhodamnia argentea TaxID=178133 RepID=A0A8B8P5G4_9MYRT|nr:two-component response regulator ARR10-like [Rhodamnia argentea]
MAIDKNSVSLSVLVVMLKRCLYKVSGYGKATETLEMLWQNKYEFDIVVIAMVGINMDDLGLLKIVDFELDLSVIVVSANDDERFMTNAILYEAKDFPKKPICVLVLQNIW